MITEDLIKSEIDRLETDLKILTDTHGVMVTEYQARHQAFLKKVTENQNRYQQLTGAITHFKQLLNGSKPNQESQTK